MGIRQFSQLRGPTKQLATDLLGITYTCPTGSSILIVVKTTKWDDVTNIPMDLKGKNGL